MADVGVTIELKERNAEKSGLLSGKRNSDDYSEQELKRDSQTSLLGETGVKLNLSDAEFGDAYTINLNEKPAGFHFDGNLVLIVYDGMAAAKAGMRPESRVLKVNDIEIKKPEENMHHLREVLIQTEAPFTLTLQQKLKLNSAPSTSEAMAGGEEIVSLSKKDFVGVLLAYLAVFLDYFGLFMGIPVLPVIADVLDIEAQKLGSLTAILIVAGIPGGIITLAISQKKGTKYGILYSMFGTAITLLLQSFASDYTSLAIFRCLAGLTGNSIPVTSTYIGMTVPKHKRARYFSYIGLCVMAAMVVAPSFGGSLVAYGVRIPWRVGCGVAFTGALISCMCLPNKEIPKASATDKGNLTGPMLVSTFLFLFKFLATSASLTMAGNFYIKYFNLKGQDIGYILTLDGVITCLFTITLYPIVNKKLGPYWTLCLGYFQMAVGHFAASFMPDYYYFAICLTGVANSGATFAFHSLNPIADSWVTPSTRAKVMSFGSIFENLGSAGAALLWGTMFQYSFDNGNPRLLWRLSSAAALLSLLVAMSSYLCYFRPRIRVREADAIVQKDKQQEHRYVDYKDEFGTDEDFMEIGKAVGTMLSERHYKWITYKQSLLNTVSNFFPPLPVDTVENHRRAVRKIVFMSKQTAAEFTQNGEEDITDHIVPPKLG